jgi:ribosomal-protein-alanine N-acetyltransferase
VLKAGTVTLSAPSPVHLEPVSVQHMEAFLKAARRSRRLHGRWVAPPANGPAFMAYLRTRQLPSGLGFCVFVGANELAGVINLNEIARGPRNSAYLGYYAFAPYANHGYMSAALANVLAHAFDGLGLHRLEANIQPENAPSIALVKRAGFRLEGFSPRYLKVAGRYRDHERWAITLEDYRALGAGS